jgi:hypothetical protein
MRVDLDRCPPHSISVTSGRNRRHTLGAHTRAAVSPDRFTADPQTHTFLESAHDKGYDATITGAFVPPSEARREQHKELGHELQLPSEGSGAHTRAAAAPDLVAADP